MPLGIPLMGAATMHQRLSDATVRTTRPTAETTYHWDGELSGFGFRITKTGVRTFVVWVGRRRHTIGRYPLISLQDARSEAKRLLAERTLGKAHKPRISHQSAVQSFLDDCRKRLRPKTVLNYKETLRHHLPFGTQVLDTITTRQITDVFRSLTLSQKEHATRVGKTYFTWCMRQGHIEKSPMSLMQMQRAPSRERVLNDEELKVIYKTALKGQTHFHKIVVLLILTGQRKSEIAQLQWDWIKGDGTIELPASVTKNKRTHTFPYGVFTNQYLAEGSRASPTKTKYLFPAVREQIKGKPSTIFNGWSKAKVAFDKECGVTNWTLHDIRRSFATNLQRLGVRLEVTEKILNHISGSQAGMVGIYQRHKYLDEMRDAFARYHAFLDKLLKDA